MPRIGYIPAERNIFSTLEHTASLKGLSGSLSSFLTDFEMAKKWNRHM